MSRHTGTWHTAHYITLLAAVEAGRRCLILDGQFSLWSSLPSVSLSRQACSTNCPQCCCGPYRIMKTGQLLELHTTSIDHTSPHHVETWPLWPPIRHNCVNPMRTLTRNFNPITSDTAVHMLIWFVLFKGFTSSQKVSVYKTFLFPGLGLAWLGLLITPKILTPVQTIVTNCCCNKPEIEPRFRQHLGQNHLRQFECVARGAPKRIHQALLQRWSYIYRNMKGQFVAALLATRESRCCNQILRCMIVVALGDDKRLYWQKAWTWKSNVEPLTLTISFSSVLITSSSCSWWIMRSVPFVATLVDNCTKTTVTPTVQVCDAFKCRD